MARGGLRADPLAVGDLESHKQPQRVSASTLRGFHILSEGIFPNGRIKATSTQNITHLTDTKINFDTIVKDSPGDESGGDADGAMADLTNERLIARHAGWYIAAGLLPWNQGSGGDMRQARLRLNGTTFIASGHAPVMGSGAFDANPTCFAWVTYQFDRDDYIELLGLHNNVSALATELVVDGPWLALTWVGL